MEMDLGGAWLFDRPLQVRQHLTGREVVVVLGYIVRYAPLRQPNL